MMGCVDCGKPVHQTIEKALTGEPREALVWADESGEWVCEDTGNEHRAMDLTPFEVEFYKTVHVLAQTEDDALVKAEGLAEDAVRDNGLDRYEDCVRTITDEEF